MKILDASELTNLNDLISVDDLSMYLSLMYHDLVDILLEFITIFSDDEMIQEIVDTLDLNITGVVEYYKNSPSLSDTLLKKVMPYE